jgi:putative restriction endonuclease
MSTTDLDIRLAAFQWLQEQVDIHGDVLPRASLQQGFTFRGKRVPLVSPQGIFKPKVMDFPLTITTTPKSPYRDRYSNGNFLYYKYRGKNPEHPDNVGLRRVMEKQLPLAYFYGLVPGRYLAIWPVFIIRDDPQNLTFTIAVEDLALYDIDAQDRGGVSEEDLGRRAYLTTTTRVRLHQRSFREKVLQAYRSQCAFCRLRHRELLDAAHIIPDRDPRGKSSVDNGLSLCKLHHAAFDSFILGVSPDYVIRVREDVLEEEDGPTLKFGLQGLHGRSIILPGREADWPNPEALDWKYQKFLEKR